MASPVALVQLQGVSKQYGRGPTAVQALRDVDLEIGAGEMVALMGPSGSGKSTLMHILGLLDRPTSGVYRLAGQDMTVLSGRAAASLRGNRIAFVFQGIHLLPSLNALRNVELPMVYARWPGRTRAERARQALEGVGLWPLARRFPAQMSGGQAQRVAVARASAPTPQLLLADEPTGALDRRSGRAVLALFQQLHSRLGLTVVLVTHDPYVAQHTQRIVHLEDGRITGDEPVRERLTAEPENEGDGR